MKEPLDLLIDFLVWIGVPAVIVSGILLLNWVATWIKFLLSAILLGRSLTSAFAALLQTWTSIRTVASVGFVLSGALVTACSYSLVQLVEVMSVNDVSGRNIADGKIFLLAEELPRLIAYDHWTPASQIAVWTPITVIGLIGLSDLGQLSNLRALLTGCSRVVSVLALVAAGVVLIAGLALVGDVVLGFGDYNLGMGWLYVVWVVLLVPGALSIRLLMRTSSVALRVPSRSSL